MKYDKDDNPADLEAAYRWIDKAGYGYALDPIKARIAELEQPKWSDFATALKRNAQLQAENERLHLELRVANGKIAWLNYKLAAQTSRSLKE